MRGFTIASFIVLVLVVVVVGVAAVLLAKTVQNAQSINDKAQNIAEVGTGINEATDSVVQLNRTNKLAESILRSANPLERQLNGIVGEARSIDALASSINGTAGDINSAAGSINQSAGSIAGSAGAINNRARAINANAGSINTSAVSIDRDASSILSTGRQIERDVRLINRNLDVSLNLATGIKNDTANILRQAVGAHDTAACIDRKLLGPSANDGDCRAQATPTSRRGGDNSRLPADARTPEGFRKLLRDKAALQRANPGADPGADVPLPNDPDANYPDPVPEPPADTGAPSPDDPGAGGGAPPDGSQPGGNIVERLFPGAFRGRAGSGK